ncbi:hypothetical protein U8Y98_01595 [Priestia megaterium]|uniref:hypothetical protein n=1 Tax=Priestia megaterium TaxID=1404 RepID=UPI002FE25E22
MYKNEHDSLNYQLKRYSPVDDFAKWYEENGKHNTKNGKHDNDHNELINKEIEKGNLDNVPAIMKIAHGLEQLQKAKEAEQVKRNKESEQ